MQGQSPVAAPGVPASGPALFFSPTWEGSCCQSVGVSAAPPSPPLVSGPRLQPPSESALLSQGNFSGSVWPLLELHAITPRCVLLNGKWNSLETAQKAEPGGPRGPQFSLRGPARAQGHWLARAAPRRWLWWRVGPGDGQETGPQASSGLSLELPAAAGLETGERRNGEVSAAPSGYAQLPAGTETRFQKQIPSFFNHFFSLW